MAKKRAKKKPTRARRAKRRVTRRPSPRKPTKRKPARRPVPKPKRRRKAPSPPPPIPRVKTRPAFISTKKVTQYRKAGRIVKQGTKGAKRYTYEVQLDRKGRILRTLELLSATKVIKTIYPGSIEEQGMSLLMPSGQRQGSLMHAMFESNVTTQYRGAKLIEVSIRGKDRGGKERRVKITIEPTKTRRLHELVMSRIMQKLRENDVRTQYSIEILRAAKAAGPLKYPLSYERFRTLEPLVGVEMVITIYR